MVTRVWRWFFPWLVGLLSVAAETLQPPGFRPLPPGAHALVGARVFTQPGTLWSNATIVIRDGRIAAVGPEVVVPADARVWNLNGKTIYAGFIDPYLALGTTNLPVANRDTQAIVAAGATATASEAGAGGYRFFGVSGQETDPGRAGPGYAIAAITPERLMSASYAPDPKQLESLRELGFTAANLVPTRGIVRGQSAFVTLGDTSPNDALVQLEPNRGTAQHIAFDVTGGEDRQLGTSVFPNSLMGVIAAIRQVAFDAHWWAEAQAAFAKEPATARRPPVNTALQGLQPALEGQTVVFEPGSILMLDRARRLATELGLKRTLYVASGDEWRRPDLIQPSLTAFIVPLAFPALPKFSRDDDWEGVGLEPLRAWDWAPENPALLRRTGATIALTTFGLGDRKEFRRNLSAALDRGLSENDALAALTTIPAQYCQLDSLLGTIAAGKLANLTICDAKGYFDPAGKVLSVWVDGRPYDFGSMSAESIQSVSAAKAEEKTQKETAEKKKAELRELAKKRVARDPGSDRGVITNPPVIWLRGATVWTGSDRGVLTNADILIRDGKFEAVGTVTPTDRVFEMDGTGLHVTPGLIDCHNHSMILGAVNEATLPSTAMVRIGDVVNSETENLHQQLAGGLTVANLLHGSANPIGGQNQVIKLREGAAPEDLKFTNAPAGIKFALGENVKQANWGEKYTTRFPQTRMGVPTFYQNRFTAAQQYAAAWQAWREGGQKGVAPRRDLELEAIAEIIEGTRLIHCHSYRQDEILAFLRTMESFGVRVATLQHILEGYKVADEIAKHGAGASSFADWWAFKFEVYDAIPYAGSLMRARGVNVSFNSDSSDHARRLNFEAAKAVKYGDTPEVEALKFVTLNPAKQLKIDRWVGSIEPGKDADWVLWSGHPLDSSSRCLQTWIDGKKYFDRAREMERTQGRVEERTQLITKAKKLAGESADAAASEAARDKFFRRALEHAQHLGVMQCQDCLLPRSE